MSSGTIVESESNSFGLSVSFSPTFVPTGGSANFFDANSESQRTNAISSIITNGSLDVSVGGTTTIIGGAIGSRINDFVLDTGELELVDLIERERSHMKLSGEI